MNKIFNEFIPCFDQNEYNSSKEILQRIINNSQLPKDKIKAFREDFGYEANRDKYIDTRDFIEKIVISQRIIERYKFNPLEKPKVCFLIFGNESDRKSVV